MVQNSDVLVGMKEIAAFLKVSRSVVYRWMAEYPEMPIHRKGKLFADVSELSGWQRQFITTCPKWNAGKILES